MTHMHIAGSIHADAINHGPQWLTIPKNLNELEKPLWSRNVCRDEDGVIKVADLKLTEVAKRFGTPTYVIDEDDFRLRAREFIEAFPGWKIYYAGKALLTKTIARWVEEEGLWLDVCSGGELAIALAEGFPAARIGLHGNNKTEAEITKALEVGVGRFVVDSFDEISRIEKICEQLNTVANVLIRVTTGVEAHTHEYIATATEDQKFGFSIASGQALVALVRVHNSVRMNLQGIHSHIGSQIFDTHGFEVSVRRTMRLANQFRQATGIQLPELCLGGGFGIAYTIADSPCTAQELAKGFNEIIEHETAAYDLEKPLLSIEPGRAICGPATLALYQVGTVKPVDLEHGKIRVYVSVDGGMSDNIRTALYGAEYSAAIVNRVSQCGPALCRIVGKHCEGGDILVRDVFLPEDIKPGDLIAVPGAGAYSISMASNYNAAGKPPLISICKDQAATLLRRETIEDIMRRDVGD